ncbi:MAG: ABC transporter substrate-binding protein, partial [Bacteroidales bacterium]|nr:ABC transporter substrate-binding protein [Bacteroidales bacterium]
EYTFKLRKGLKWSDGAEVTMDDYRFAFEDCVFNAELTPVVDSYLRAGGKSTGEPLTFEAVDDETFKISFAEKYGGFLAHLSVAGWKGYASYLKPAHFLKQFHKDYAVECHGSLDAYYEFLKPYAEAMGYSDVAEEGVWAKIFAQIDCVAGEMTNSSVMLTSKMYAAAGMTQDFPVLYPWTLTSDENNVVTWTRNPYYFKVDAAGQQLPYCDYVTSTLYENQEMLQMQIISGSIDYLRESATINNVTLYLENEESAGIKVHFYSLNNTPTDCMINMNYGLNTDGTVKDDEQSQAWQEVIGDKRFREALACAIDVDEIIEAVYTGFAEPDREYTALYNYDPAYANGLLDEMGMLDADGDGYRETPSGKKLQWMIFNADDASDIIPVCELLVEYWNTELGLNVTATTTESSLLATSVSANEIPMRVMWAPIDITWFNLNWGQNTFGPLWDTWYKNGGLNAAEGTDVGGIEPSAEVKEFYTLLEAVMTGSPAEAVETVLPALHALVAENLWVLIPLQNVQQSVIASAKLHNIPVGGVGIAGNFVAELFFYGE